MLSSREGSHSCENRSLSSPFRALRSRNFRLFLIGQSISLSGTWMTRLATSWLVYRITDSAFLLGVVGFAGQIPAFFLPAIAGVWLDRWDRHRVLIVTQVLAMLQSLTLAALTLSGHVNIGWIIFLTLVQGVITAVEIPTRQSFVIHMVEDRADLSNAIALNSSNFNVASLVGPAIAGLVVAAVGEGYCFLIDGLSYIAVIAGLLMMRLKKEKPPRHMDSHLKRDLLEGWRYVSGFRPIRWYLLFLALMGIARGPYSVLLPIIAGNVLHGNAHTLGCLMAAAGVGALACAIGLVLRHSVLGLGRLMTIAVGIFALGSIGLGLSHWFWISLPLMAITGYGLMTQVVVTNTVIQTLVDDNKRGRVMAYYTMALQGSMPIGSLLSGSLAARIGAPNSLVVSGIACALLTIWFWRKLPEIREIVRPRYTELGILTDA